MRDLGNKAAMAQNLRRLMNERNINAKEFSRVMGYPYTTLLSWLKADNYPRIDRIEEMSRYFGVKKSDLIEERVTEEMQKDHGTIADTVIRMRTDAEFCYIVEKLLKMDPSELGGVRQMLDALQAFSK